MKGKTIFWFLIGIVVIILYGLFDPEKVAFPKCPFREFTGWLCPGCGSQRAMHQVLHGHFGAAFHLNPLFIPGIVYIMVGYASAGFFPEKWPYLQRTFYGLKAAYVSLAVIVVFWIGRNLI
ncbi:MAG TPA: DUF2752 domain-containing protein [Saprospiraceae bacterium]|nr:DUF2752 domain-containing protein [Saprospiraceae bacterium]